MNKSLLLSLGHNSSAIVVDENCDITGYEQERLSRIKSDSQYPQFAIDLLMDNSIQNVMVSHWDPFCDLNNMNKKYWNPQSDIKSIEFLATLNIDFTHHDAHAYSAIAFAEDIHWPEDTHIIIADGFGNFGETLSIYKLDKGIPDLIFRSRGYSSSLGLMYQYTTAHLGLKPHQDEYKLLGYAGSANCSSRMRSTISELTDIMLSNITKSWDSSTDPLLYPESLIKTQRFWDIQLEKFSRNRFTISYVIQKVLENVICELIKIYDMKNIICAGGVFLNVELNRKILNKISGGLCIMPLAGDQGAPLGLLKYHYPEFKFPNTLCWGLRNYNFTKLFPLIETLNDFQIVQLESEAKSLICDYLNKDYIVNLIKGNMEFGPRALCNTSTLALPNKKNADYINRINNRSSIMPMGPVVTKEWAVQNIYNLNRVHKSAEYMVIALPCTSPDIYNLGVTHDYQGEYTMRPQVVTKICDTFIYDIIIGTTSEMLINTSFNTHGEPIVFSLEDIINSHIQQKKRDEFNRIKTIVFTGEEL